jgi:alpha-tubulin suppressor-like RCC1 family protein
MGEGATVVLREHGRIHSAGANPTPIVSATSKVAYTALGQTSVSGSPTFSNFAEVLGSYYVKRIWHGHGKLFIQRNDGIVYGYGLDWDANRASLQWIPVKDSEGKPLICTDLSARANNPVVLRDDSSVTLLGPIADWHRPQEFPASQTNVLQPSADIRFLSGIRKLSTGRSHLAAITQTGFLHTAGSDRYGQLCSAKYQHRNPYHGYLLDDEPVVDVACGDHHTVVLCRDGRVKTGGRNDRGQLGRAVPVGNGHDWLYSVGADHVTQEGWFGNMDYVPGITDAVAIYAGGDSTIIVRRSGIDVCGDNEFGQLGITTEQHIFNDIDRSSWRESWQGDRTPFLTNRQNAVLFPDQNV